MTLLEALAAEIEPYSLSDESCEKALIDSGAHFDEVIDTEAEYSADFRQIVALGAMYALNRLRVLSSESLGSISASYNVKELMKRIEAIAKAAGLSPSLIDADNAANDSITYVPCW